MPVYTDEQRRELLEQLVDASSLADVLDDLGWICQAKADHIAHNWQDAPLAARWERAASRLATQYQRAESENL
jgi:hypothetical protein